MSYSRSTVFSDDNINYELDSISSEIQTLSEVLPTSVCHAEPKKLMEGMLVYADGIDWDPGLGEGLYFYIDTTWKRISLE